MFGFDTNSFWLNVFLSMLVSFTGGLGIFITRVVKTNWSGQTWTYVPIFWLPIFFSWPVALVALFGGFDK